MQLQACTPLSPSLILIDDQAGRISVGGFIPKQLAVSSTRDTASSSTVALPPESVLFRTKYAPTRYAESDIYFSNEKKSIRGLPESDLLKALHSYISDFYARVTSDGGQDDWQSLDETALIALGVLLEEAALDTLGATGDLVFTEGGRLIEPQPIATAGSHLMNKKGRPSKKRRIESIDGIN